MFFLLGTLAAALAAAPPPKVSLAELQKLLSSYQRVQTLQASFDQKKRLKDLGLTLESTGTFTLKPKEGVVWKVTAPAPLEMRLTRGKVELTSGAGKEARTETWALAAAGPETAKSMAGVVAWLKMDAHEIDAEYDIVRAGDGYLCTPKDAEKNLFRTLTMKLGSTGHLERLKIEEKSGDEMEFTFSKPRIQYIK